MKREDLLLMRRIINDVSFDGVCDSISVDDLNNLRINIQLDIEKRDLHDFLRHMEEAMPAADDEEAWDAFYNKPFRIVFDHKSIELPMDASVYENISGLIEQYIEEQYLDGPNIVKATRLYRSLLFVRTYIERLKKLEAADGIDPDAYHYNLHGLKDKMYEIIDDLIDYFKYQGGYM
jgi:hypothetical protein